MPRSDKIIVLCQSCDSPPYLPAWCTFTLHTMLMGPLSRCFLLQERAEVAYALCSSEGNLTVWTNIFTEDAPMLTHRLGSGKVSAFTAAMTPDTVTTAAATADGSLHIVQAPDSTSAANLSLVSRTISSSTTSSSEPLQVTCLLCMQHALDHLLASSGKIMCARDCLIVASLQSQLLCSPATCARCYCTHSRYILVSSIGLKVSVTGL